MRDEKPIVILDDNGSALGVVYGEGDKLILKDKGGKLVREVSEKMTIKQVKNILVNSKLGMVVV